MASFERFESGVESRDRVNGILTSTYTFNVTNTYEKMTLKYESAWLPEGDAALTTEDANYATVTEPNILYLNCDVLA